jgi:hypothetical protein
MSLHRKYSIRHVGPSEADYPPAETTSKFRTASEFAADESADWKDGVRIDVWDGHDWQERNPDFTMTVGKFQPDDEVSITVRGRFVAELGGRLVVEYVGPAGLPDRITVAHDSRDVWANLEIPNDSTRRRRSEAAERVAAGCVDPHKRESLMAKLPYGGRYREGTR